MGKKVKAVGKQLIKSPNNHFLRGQYFNLKWRYKATCKKEKRKSERKLLQNLENLHTYSNEEFWNLFKQYVTWISNSPIIEWFRYKYLPQKTATWQNKTSQNRLTLNQLTLWAKEITIKEVKESIKYLKTKKAPGLNNITNEIIKCSGRNIIEQLQALFNNIMESGYYPTFWNQGLIFSIHKSGKKDDPNNYRGINLSNCLGKLFNTILNNRL